MPPERSHLVPNLLSFEIPQAQSIQIPFSSSFPIAPLPVHPPLQIQTHNQKPKRFVSRPLQRNQACSTCRSRKVRCDASKPACGACRRSAAAHGENPDIVSCHYDSDPPNHLTSNTDQHLHSAPAPSSTDPIRKTNSKVAILEQKIADLESLIAQLDLQSHQDHHSEDLLTNPELCHSLDRAPCAPSAAFAHPSQPSVAPHGPAPATERSADAVLWPNWPASLPPRPMLTQLVALFLAHNTGTGQSMFLDHPALQAALHLPPHHPHFPPLALLHAILALALRLHPAPDELARSLVQNVGAPPYWPPTQSVDQFHYYAAKSAIEHALLSGTQLFKTTQALVLVCHYAYRAARLVEVWVLTGLAVRFATPLGLNRLETCAGHLDGSKPLPRVLLPPPRTVAEKYERAATFWSAFQMDRFLAVASGRAHSIDEADISSLLPACPGTGLASLAPIDPARNPLALSHPHFFSVHPPDVDARQVELKATVLLGRIAAWLRRAPSPVGFNLAKVWRVPNELVPDLRSQPEFVRLDQDLISLQLSLPRSLTQTLFSTPSCSNSGTETARIEHSKIMLTLLINLCEMLLHECFISREPGNASLIRCTEAARRCKGVCDVLSGSGFELRFLDRFMVFCLRVAIRQLMRDLVSTELRLLESLSSATCSSSSYQTTSAPYGLQSLDESNSLCEKLKQRGETDLELQECVNQRVADVQTLVGFVGSVERAIDGPRGGPAGGGGGVAGSGDKGEGERICEGIVEAFDDRFRLFKVPEKVLKGLF